MKQKFFVPHETAQALKAAGYPQCDCYIYDHCYLPNDKEPLPYFLVDEQKHTQVIVAPTYHEAIDWLEENGVKVWAEWIGDDWQGVCVWSSAKIRYTNHYGSREEALNATILAVLEMEVV